MPAGSAGIGIVLDRYRALLDRMDAAARMVSAPASAGPCGGCRACCSPLSLLPLEARALLATGLLDDRAPAAAACPLLDEARCRLGAAQPFACRARGLPARQLDAEGQWITGSCGLAAQNGHGQAAAVPLAEWAALLFRLDREFRARAGVAALRIALADLCRAPDRYRALLAIPGGRPLVPRAPSRSAT